MDVLTPEQRRKNMAAIKSRNTGIEMRLRRALWSRGFRYRVRTSLPGSPDIVFPSRRVVVFCDGCFWHGCPKCYRRPATNEDYWTAKIARNKRRDEQITRQLESDGWTVLRYWGCDIEKRLDAVLADIESHLQR